MDFPPDSLFFSFVSHSNPSLLLLVAVLLGCFTWFSFSSQCPSNSRHLSHLAFKHSLGPNIPTSQRRRDTRLDLSISISSPRAAAPATLSSGPQAGTIPIQLCPSLQHRQAAAEDGHPNLGPVCPHAGRAGSCQSSARAWRPSTSPAARPQPCPFEAVPRSGLGRPPRPGRWRGRGKEAADPPGHQGRSRSSPG